MNGWTMPRMKHLFAFAAATSLALLSACKADPGPAPLAGAAIGGPFTLTGEDGKPVSWADFDGKYRVVYFGYTFCPSICPTDMLATATALKLLDKQAPEKSAKIAALFITVDPERDTPEVVSEFTNSFDKRIIGITGSPEDIKEAAKKFAVFASRSKANANGAYLVDHTNVTYLFGPKGEPITTLPVDQGGQAVAAELEKWAH